MSQLEGKKHARYTYSDYCSWPEDERWELIDGEAFDMTPTPTRLHQEISVNLLGFLWTFFNGKVCQVYHAPFDVRLPKNDETDDQIDTVVQPDILVVCDPKKLDDKGCRGAPDFIIEILSSSTSSKDQIRKRRLYERHGVKEYWLLHPLDRIVMVYRLGSAGRFGPVEILDGEGLKLEISQFPGLMVDFTRIFPPLPRVVRESPRKFTE